MITNDGTIIQIKHETLCEIAKLVFSGEYEEKKEELPYRLMPGPQAKYRCCVYKEREIVRQRIRLAEGKNAEGATNDLTIQVVRAACEGCPISRYVVTDNCQKCMGKACQQSCKFGAIDIGRNRAHIDPTKCKECGRCAAACPYNAIADLIRPCRRNCPVDAVKMDENGICYIDEKKCIQCGVCIHSCPFGAISSKSCIVDVCKDIVNGVKLVAMLAPATEGQFGENITFSSWRQALQEVGFLDLVEVGLGGDMTAYYEAQEWIEAHEKGEKKVTSCCPAFVNLVRQQYPMLEDHISTTISPMCAVSRLIKSRDPQVKTVFVGPCVAKKSEVADQKIPGNADYVMTYGEIRALLRAKGVTLKPMEEEQQDASTFGKRFANHGGVTKAIEECMAEQGKDPSGIQVQQCNGASECKKALLLLKMGRLPADFIEGMACEGGCVGGPSRHTDIHTAKRARDRMIDRADHRTVKENLERYDMDAFSMHR